MIRIWNEGIHQVDVAVTPKQCNLPIAQAPNDAAMLAEDHLVVRVSEAGHGRQHVIDFRDLKCQFPFLGGLAWFGIELNRLFAFIFDGFTILGSCDVSLTLFGPG